MTMTAKIFANEKVMKAFARKGQGLPDPQRFGGKVASALDAAVAGVGATMRPIRQAGVRAAIAPSGPIQERPTTQLTSAPVAPVAPVQSSGLGSVDVTQPQGFTPLSIGEMATNNPEIARTLGIRGTTADLLGRT
jgi:hypothetical protein